MYETSDLRKNLKIQIEGDPYVVVDCQFVKPGKGVAFTRTKMRNMITGNVVERTFRSGEKFQPADLVEQKMQFMYADEMYHFMNTETYEQLEFNENQVGDARLFLLENLHVDVLFFKDGPSGSRCPRSSRWSSLRRSPESRVTRPPEPPSRPSSPPAPSSRYLSSSTRATR